MGEHEYDGSIISLPMLSAEESKSSPSASTWYEFTEASIEDLNLCKHGEAALFLKAESVGADTITFELEVHNDNIDGWAQAASTYNIVLAAGIEGHQWVANINLKGVSRIRLSRFQTDGTDNLSKMNAYLQMKV